VGTDKRQRKKANRAARLQIEQKTARRQNQIRRVVLFAAVIIGVLVLALLFNLLSGGGDDDTLGPLASVVAQAVATPPTG
jgi:hypothetical protein